jgi:galactokinase
VVHSGVERVAFAPGRVNLIGEHTDYNEGLALPFAIDVGVTVRAHPLAERRIEAVAADLDERDEFSLDTVTPAPGWRAFVRGVAAELRPARGARLHISATVPRGAGLASSAALSVALALALAPGDELAPDRLALARLCSRVENEWVGARTGLLDQLACLHGQAVLIDFRTLQVRPVALELGGWRLVTLDSGERHAHAVSGYNERRAECARARKLAGMGAGMEHLPAPLDRRMRHVTGENARVDAALAALERGDMPALGRLLDASHASLRDDYEVSTPAVEAAVDRLRRAGAAGSRLIGGGFGGHVLGLLPPDAAPPPGAREVRPGPGARVL